jgi:hypothetical protein
MLLVFLVLLAVPLPPAASSPAGAAVAPDRPAAEAGVDPVASGVAARVGLVSGTRPPDGRLRTLPEAGPPAGQAVARDTTSGERLVRPAGGLRGAPPDSIVTGRLLGVTGTLVGINAGLYIYQRHAWWAAEHRGPFHFHDDGGYSEHLDKVGHFHATYLQSQIIARSLRWSGLSHESAALWGALAAYALQLNVEINDGFNELWGFDPYDLLANTLGAGFFYARERVPALQPFVLKFTYWPSEHLTAEQEGAFEDRPPSPIDDYLGHTYWVSMRVHDLLPQSARSYWPRWLAVAAGVSGDQLYTPEARRSYYLALDLDMERIIPTETWLGRTAVEILSFLKVPAPAVRLTPRPTFYLLYYGQN